MNISLAEALDSRTFVKESSSLSFSSPKTYIQPFIDIVGEISSMIKVSVQDPVINLNDDGSENISYPRVLVEAKVGNEIAGYDSTVGFLYALDQAKIKVFSGQEAHACTNLTIFNAENVAEVSLLTNIKTAYDKIKQFLGAKAEEVKQFMATKEELLNTFYNREALEAELGRILLLTTNKKKAGFPVTGVTQAAQWLQDKQSIYYVQPDQACSKLNLYDAFTQSITNSNDILHKPNKTVAVARLLAIA